MPSNPNVYISCDDLALVEYLESELRELSQNYPLFITFGRGDATHMMQWYPSHYGLAVFIVSPPAPGRRRAPDWYRLQTELQSFAHPSNQDNLPNTLMFIHSDMSNIEKNMYFTNSQVLNNIIRLGRNWIEFDKNARIN